jgi:predicted MFS family arabinose efflux permease
VGYLYNRAGYVLAPFVTLATCGGLLLLTRWVPDRTRDPAARRSAAHHGGAAIAGRFGSVSRAFALQPRLLGVLAALTLGYAGTLGAVTFVGIRIGELGGVPSDVALSPGIAAFMEIPGLMATGWLVRRIGLRSVFLGALLMQGACIASWGVLSTPAAINATRLVTGLSFGALVAARVLVVARLLPLQLQGTGQALMMAMTFGLGTVVGDVVGGLQYSAFGATAFFIVAGIAATAGGVSVWFALREPLTELGDGLPETT